jgi:hypothetical protein
MPDVLHGGGLPDYVVIWVPGTRNVFDPLDDETFRQYTIRTQDFLTGLFGGSTTSIEEGTWTTADEDQVRERVAHVKSFAGELTAEHLRAIEAYCHSLKDELGQEAIAAEICRHGVSALYLVR